MGADGSSSTANWAFNFLVVMVTPIMFAKIQWKTYLVVSFQAEDSSTRKRPQY